MTTMPNEEDDALLFFQEVVEPTVSEFLATPADKRRGVLAALAVAAMTEHFYHARPVQEALKLSDFKRELRNENKALGWIADVANATKHVRRPEQGNKIGYSDMNVVPTGVVGVMRFGWPLNGGPELTVGPHSEWRLVDLLNSSMQSWRSRLGI